MTNVQIAQYLQRILNAVFYRIDVYAACWFLTVGETDDMSLVKVKSRSEFKYAKYQPLIPSDFSL